MYVSYQVYLHSVSRYRAIYFSWVLPSPVQFFHLPRIVFIDVLVLLSTSSISSSLGTFLSQFCLLILFLSRITYLFLFSILILPHYVSLHSIFKPPSAMNWASLRMAATWKSMPTSYFIKSRMADPRPWARRQSLARVWPIWRCSTSSSWLWYQPRVWLWHYRHETSSN